VTRVRILDQIVKKETCNAFDENPLTMVTRVRIPGGGIFLDGDIFLDALSY